MYYKHMRLTTSFYGIMVISNYYGIFLKGKGEGESMAYENISCHTHPFLSIENVCKSEHTLAISFILSWSRINFEHLSIILTTEVMDSLGGPTLFSCGRK